MTMHSLRGVVLLLSSFSLACAIQVGAADHADDFAFLASLGAPDVTDGTYVRVKGERYFWAKDMLASDYPTSGNAWLLEEEKTPDGRLLKGTFVVNGAEVVEIHYRRSGTRIPGGAPVGVEKPDSRLYGEWSPADYKKDARNVLRFFKENGKEPFPEVRLNIETRGRIFLFALQLHQKGDAEDATLILDNLCERSGGVRVIDDAADVLADSQCNTLYRTFRKDFDWVAYRRGVRELLERPQQHWRARHGARILLELIERHVDGPSVLPKAVEGFGEADRKLADDLLRIRFVRSSPRYQPSAVLWMLPATWPDSLRVRGVIGNDPDLAVRARGIEAVPFLLALAKDGEILTEADAAETLRGADGFIPYNATRGSDGPSTAFKKLQRPATRGEVAARMLANIVPVDVSGDKWIQNKTGDGLLDACRNFYEKHNAASPEELACLFLRGDDSDHGSPAMEFLMLADAERCVPIIMRYLVDSEKKRAGKLRKIAEQLSTIPYGKPLDELMEMVRSGQANENVKGMILAKLSKMPSSEACGFLLQTAVNSDSSARFYLVELIARWQSRLKSQGVLEKALRATDHADAWRALLNDDRIVSKTSKPTVTDYLLALNEHFFSSKTLDQLYGDRPYTVGGVLNLGGINLLALCLLQDYGSRGRELLRARVLARLDGQAEETLPAYPGDVPSDEEFAAMARGLAAAASIEQVTEVVRKLSLNGLLALPGFLQKNAELNAKLRVFADTIVGVSVEGDEVFKGAVAQWKGRRVAPELIQALHTYCLTRTAGGQPTTCLLRRMENCGGCVIDVRPATPGEMCVSGIVSKYPEEGIVGVTGLVCAPGVYGAAQWRAAPLPEKTDRGTFTTSTPDQKAKFFQAVEDFCGPTVVASSAGFVRFLSKGTVK